MTELFRRLPWYLLGAVAGVLIVTIGYRLITLGWWWQL